MRKNVSKTQSEMGSVSEFAEMESVVGNDTDKKRVCPSI